MEQLPRAKSYLRRERELWRERSLGFLAAVRIRFLTTQHFFDRPSFDYQPLPWLGFKSAAVRGVGTEHRWQLINTSLPQGVSSLKDVGCCVGFFCHKFVEERGGYSIGIDHNENFIEIANRVRYVAALESAESFVSMKVTPTSVRLLPHTQVTLLLSIWHHWVRDFGLAQASSMLESVWNSSTEFLFFESGEEEVADEFNLPFVDGAREWITSYLTKLFPEAEISVVGESNVGQYGHYGEAIGAKRGLFMLRRTSLA